MNQTYPNQFQAVVYSYFSPETNLNIEKTPQRWVVFQIDGILDNKNTTCDSNVFYQKIIGNRV